MIEYMKFWAAKAVAELAIGLGILLIAVAVILAIELKKHISYKMRNRK